MILIEFNVGVSFECCVATASHRAQIELNRTSHCGVKYKYL